MRPSKNEHVLALLRGIIDCGQKQIADWVGCSARTIQSVELGKLNLSESLATRIYLATGVSSGWLVDNDLTRPAVDSYGERYTKQSFEHWQAKKSAPASEKSRAFVPPLLLGYYARLRQIFSVALDKRTESLAWYKLRRFVESLDEEVTGKSIDCERVFTLPNAEFALRDAQIAIRYFHERSELARKELSADFACNLSTLDTADESEVPASDEGTPGVNAPVNDPTREDFFPVTTVPAGSPKISTPPLALRARGSGGKASSGPRARVARKSPRRS